MNRRDFFKTSAIAAAAVSMSAIPTSASVKPPSLPLRESLDEILEFDRHPGERSFMWEQSQIYDSGDIVGHDSSVFVSLSHKSNNQLPPSEDLEGWQRI